MGEGSPALSSKAQHTQAHQAPVLLPQPPGKALRVSADGSRAEAAAPPTLGWGWESQASSICSLKCRGQITGWTLGLREAGRQEERWSGASTLGGLHSRVEEREVWAG